MERGDLGAGPMDSTADTIQSKSASATVAVRRPGAPALERARGRGVHLADRSEPPLPFWLLTLLFLGLPVTLAGVLLLTWMALFG